MIKIFSREICIIEKEIPTTVKIFLKRVKQEREKLKKKIYAWWSLAHLMFICRVTEFSLLQKQLFFRWDEMFCILTSFSSPSLPTFYTHPTVVVIIIIGLWCTNFISIPSLSSSLLSSLDSITHFVYWSRIIWEKEYVKKWGWVGKKST